MVPPKSEPPIQVSSLFELIAVQQALDVQQDLLPVAEQRAHALHRERLERRVCDGEDHGVHLSDRRNIREINAVQPLRLRRVRRRVRDQRLDAVFAQFPHDVVHLAVTGVRAVLLEREAEDRHLRVLHILLRLDEALHAVLRDILAHVVVDAAAGQDDLAVVAQHLRLVRQVVRVDADAVAADEPRPEVQEVPFRSRGLQHGFRVYPHAVEDDGQLVHERDVDVPLRVLDDLRGLRDLDAGRAVHARLHDEFVHFRHRVQRLRVHAGDDLLNIFQTVQLVAGVDPLGGVADLEVHAALQAGLLLENRHADVLSHARIDRAFEHDDAALLQIPPENPRRAFNGRKVRCVVVIHGRRHGDDVERRLLQLRLVRRKLHFRLFNYVVAHFVRRVDSSLVQVDLRLVQIEADDVDLLCERHGDRHADVAQAN